VCLTILKEEIVGFAEVPTNPFRRKRVSREFNKCEHTYDSMKTKYKEDREATDMEEDVEPPLYMLEVDFRGSVKVMT
jgi:hypothetical protein